MCVRVCSQVCDSICSSQCTVYIDSFIHARTGLLDMKNNERENNKMPKINVTYSANNVIEFEKNIIISVN